MILNAVNGAIYMFEIVKKCKNSHPAQDQVAGDTHAEEYHNALQFTVHTVYFILGTTYWIEILQSYITKAVSYL